MLEEFENHRSLLFAIAYRMLGSIAEAEDAVQDAFLRIRDVRIEDIRTPKAYLTTIVTRLCLDRLKTAQHQRETYIGPWLPEPIVTDDSFERAELHESITMAFLALLERLSPPERAVFLLREVFDYGYGEIADIVGKSESSCRQLFHRAQSAVQAGRPRFTPDPAIQEKMLHAFMAAAGSGDIASLEHLLAEDVTIWSDGGGRVSAARNPIHGRTAVVRFLVKLLQKAPMEITARQITINGTVSLVFYTAEVPFLTISLEHDDSTIYGLRFMLNPDKLTHVPSA